MTDAMILGLGLRSLMTTWLGAQRDKCGVGDEDEEVMQYNQLR